VLEPSAFARNHATDIDEICAALTPASTFWQSEDFSTSAKASWYGFFGEITLDDRISRVTPTEAPKADYIEGPEKDEDTPEPGPRDMRLVAFESVGASPPGESALETTIQSVYSSELVDRAHRLHDNMVRLIGRTCLQKSAQVFEDPATVDLLVVFRGLEFIVEVKSTTFRNLVRKLRMAIGQTLHYEFLRQKQSNLPKRKVVAVTGDISVNHWSVEFLNTHLDMDLLGLREGRLITYSPSELSVRLFS